MESLARRSFCLAALWLTVLTSACSVGDGSADSLRDVSSEVVASLRGIQQGVGNQFPAKTLLSEQWDSAILLRPYMRPADVLRGRVGDLSDRQVAQLSDIEFLDTFHFIVFVRGSRAFAFAKIWMEDCNFSGGAQSTRTLRIVPEDPLVAVRSDSGRIYVSVAAETPGSD